MFVFGTSFFRGNECESRDSTFQLTGLNIEKSGGFVLISGENNQLGKLNSSTRSVDLSGRHPKILSESYEQIILMTFIE